MKALVLHANARIEEAPLKLEEVSVPSPRAREVLVRVNVCGVCRTDLHVIEGDIPQKRSPIIPGHQVVGTVEKLGAECTKLKLGDRVGVAWLASTCGECEFCKTGKENLCDGSQYTGYTVNGGYAEYVTAREDFIYKLPENIDDEHVSPLLCAGIIGFRALKKSAVKPGESLALFGFGSSAHITIQIAKYWNCEIFVATRGEAHRKLAKELGAVWVGDTFDKIPARVDSGIVFAPAGEVIPHALRALKKGGTISLAGIHISDIPPMKYEECLFHEKHLTSVESNTREDGIELLAEASKAKVKTHVITFPLEDANNALLKLKTDGLQGTGVLRVTVT